MSLTEDTVEDAALAWPESVGGRITRDLEFAPDAPMLERFIGMGA